MKSTHVKLMLVISLSLLLLVTFYNETYADISRYNWEFPHPPVKMIPVKEGMCALTGMAGKFRGGGEAVFVDQSGDHWYLGGFSKQGYMWAQAHCIKYKDLGKDFANIKYTSTSDWLGCSSATCGPDIKQLYWAGYCTAVFLQGISGDFERPSPGQTPGVFGGYVTWKDGSYTNGWIGVSASGRRFKQEGTRHNYIYAPMRGRLGCLQGSVPTMNNKNYKNIEYKRASFKIPQNQDVQTNYLANSYFCTIARVGGYFHGGGERVNLTINSKGEWVMQGQTMQTYADMSAWCFRYK